MIKHQELGVLLVDSGDVVCFSMDEVSRLAALHGVNSETLIARHKGVVCDFAADGNYGVDKLTAIDHEGNSFPVVMIGGNPETFVRFISKDDQSFRDFYEKHPRKAEVRTGENFAFNQTVWDEIVAEYQKQLKGSVIVP